MQSLEVRDPHLVEAAILLIWSIMKSEVAVKQLEHSIINGERDGERRRYLAGSLYDDLKLGIVVMVVARHAKRETFSTIRPGLVALGRLYYRLSQMRRSQVD